MDIFYKILGCSLALGLGLGLMPASPAHAYTALPEDKSAAVILSYHRVGEDQYPPTNIRIEQFQEHLQELENGTYTIMPLPEIIQAMKTGAPLPDRTVALTFDGAYSSAIETAAPILLRKNIPFTIFVATETMAPSSDQYATADDIRKLARNKLVTIGLHPANYGRLSEENDEEIRRQIHAARATIRDLTGAEATLFAYPVGEFNMRYRNIVSEMGFDAAFGQQSGVAYHGADMYALPRFTMTETYGGLDRFRLTADALPLPVTEIEPRDPYLDISNPTIGFTIHPALSDTSGRLVCFVSGHDKPQIERLSGNRIELRLDRDLGADRTRINCTLPEKTGEFEDDIRWRWFGMMLSPPPHEEDSRPDDTSANTADNADNRPAE